MVITELFLIAVDSNHNAHPVTDAGNIMVSMRSWLPSQNSTSYLSLHRPEPQEDPSRDFTVKYV